jgi:hypothetical protein
MAKQTTPPATKHLDDFPEYKLPVAHLNLLRRDLAGHRAEYARLTKPIPAEDPAAEAAEVAKEAKEKGVSVRAIVDQREAARPKPADPAEIARVGKAVEATVLLIALEEGELRGIEEAIRREEAGKTLPARQEAAHELLVALAAAVRADAKLGAIRDACNLGRDYIPPIETGLAAKDYGSRINAVIRAMIAAGLLTGKEGDLRVFNVADPGNPEVPTNAAGPRVVVPRSGNAYEEHLRALQKAP